MKANWGSEVTLPFILNLGIRLSKWLTSRSVRFNPPPPPAGWKEPYHLWSSGLGEPQIRYKSEEEKNLIALSGIEQFLDGSARSLVTI